MKKSILALSALTAFSLGSDIGYARNVKKTVKNTSQTDKDIEKDLKGPDLQSVRGNPVVATISGAGISDGKIEVNFGDVLKAMQSLPPQVQQALKKGELPLGKAFEGTRDEVVNTKILREAAGKEAGRLKADLEVQEEIKEAVKRVILNAYLREITNSVTDKDIKGRYKKEVDKIDKNEKEVSFRYIVLNKKEKADSLIKDLKSGSDFLNPPPPQKGGDVGFLRKNSMPKPIADVIYKKGSFDLALEPGKFTVHPIKYGELYIIVKVDNVRKIRLPKLKEMYEPLKKTISQERIKDKISGLEKKLKVERFDPVSGKPVKAFSDSMKDVLEKMKKLKSLKKPQNKTAN